MSDRCGLCGEKITLSRPGRDVDWVHLDCWERAELSREEIVGSREVDLDLLEAVGALVARDENFGSWPGGLPECFGRIRERLRLSESDVNWVLVVENWVKKKALEELLFSREEIARLRARAGGGVVPSMIVRHRSPEA